MKSIKEVAKSEVLQALELRDRILSRKQDLKDARAATSASRMAYDWARLAARQERAENPPQIKKPGRKRAA